MAIWPLLQHIVAVEYGERIACRFAARTLADLGASVIKVIGGGAAEDRRSVHAPPLDLYLDFNKKFVRVSSEAQNGGSELKQLLERAHIVREDGSLGRRSRRSGLEAWGKVATPVGWLSITPFGATGPYKDYSSYSLTLAHGSGEAKGIKGRPHVHIPHLGLRGFQRANELTSQQIREERGCLRQTLYVNVNMI